MIEIGRHHRLRIERRTENGLYLEDKFQEEVLLPNKYCPDNYEVDDILRVFIYRDHEERIVATTLEPKITLDKFAFLEVSDSSSFGAFLDWGLEKELLVPFREQRLKMQEGKSYVVRLCIDELTDRLFASQKVDKFLQNELLNINEGEEVDILIYQKTDLGYAAIINHEHRGLIYFNEVFEPLRIGQSMKAFIKKIRPDHKIDLSLQALGYVQSIEPNVAKVQSILLRNGGFSRISDKSTPEAISKQFGMSKKSFKKALGALYKQRLVEITAEGIKLTAPVNIDDESE